MKSLYISARDRLTGQTITCGICQRKGHCSTKTPEGKTKWVCKKTGKKLGSCPNPESQKFLSTLYNPFTSKSDILIKHTTRDFWEFRTRHNELLEVAKEIKLLYREGKLEQAMQLVKAYKPKKEKNSKQKDQQEEDKTADVVITPETYLETAIVTYSNFLDREIGEEWEKRPDNKQTVNNYKRALERFHACLVKNGYNPEIIMLKAISKEHIKKWVSEVKNTYPNHSTQNHYLNDISIFLSWCRKRGGGEIDNTLDLVKRGHTAGDNKMIDLDDFNKMISNIRPDNGTQIRKSINHASGKTRTKTDNHYTTWLSDGLWLSLLLGGRGDDINEFKWSEIILSKSKDGKDIYRIEMFDHKFFQNKKTERYNSVAMYSQTLKILLRLGLKEKIGTEEYVIAPEIEKRSRVQQKLSRAFTWYWKDISNLDETKKFKHLRKTHITLTSMLAGENSKYIQKHTNSDTTRKHYFDASLALFQMSGIDFYDVDVA